jgi:hypothetical protein
VGRKIQRAKSGRCNHDAGAGEELLCAKRWKYMLKHNTAEDMAKAKPEARKKRVPCPGWTCLCLPIGERHSL